MTRGSESKLNTAASCKALRAGENGERVNFFDPVALSQKLLAALNDPGQGQALRTAARATAHACWFGAGVAAHEQVLGLNPVAAHCARQVVPKVVAA